MTASGIRPEETSVNAKLRLHSSATQVSLQTWRSGCHFVQALSNPGFQACLLLQCHLQLLLCIQTPCLIWQLPRKIKKSWQNVNTPLLHSLPLIVTCQWSMLQPWSAPTHGDVQWKRKKRRGRRRLKWKSLDFSPVKQAELDSSSLPILYLLFVWLKPIFLI